MTRPLCATIDLDALHHNLMRVRKVTPEKLILAVIKADAYGHGLIRCAKALEDADAFGIASLEEAMELRMTGIENPIVLLEGFFSSEELEPISHHQLDVVVHDRWQLEALEHASLDHPLTVWLKLNSGMNRLGVPEDEVLIFWDRLTRCKNVAPEIRLMTHLACADEPKDPANARQLESFNRAIEGLRGETSIANSAAILALPDHQGDWVRPGLILYGASPFPNNSGEDLGLRPAMRLETRLIAVNQCRKGGAVGYGGKWKCLRDMPVGVAAIGYGDGYPRHAPPGTPVLLNGQRVTLVGHVSMDMITLDLTSQPDAQPGDRVLLWGSGLPAEEIARAAETIPYELFCGVTARVPRSYSGGD